MYWNKPIEEVEYEEGKTDYTKAELEQMADTLLRQHGKKELCRECMDDTDGDEVEGRETGYIESIPQYRDGQPVLSEEGLQINLQLPELKCPVGHIWYLGEGKSRGHAGENAVLFEEHLIQRKRREIYTAEGSPDPSIVQGLYNRCVDTETKALTKKGWKYFHELSIGDKIRAYDINKNSFRWKRLQEVYVQEFDGRLYSYESETISALVSEGHNWAVINGNEFEDKNARRMIVQSGSTLLAHHYIILGDYRYVHVEPAMNGLIKYKGRIWCPRVSTGFWLAQRNEITYVTGNTHPSGRKVNSPEARKLHGASYYK